MELRFYLKEFWGGLASNISYPAIGLSKDNWDDYGHKITFTAFFFKNYDEQYEIGNVKILDKRTDTTILPDNFLTLDNNFCSLGQSLDYYENLKKFLPDSFLEVLHSLNDIVFNDEVQQEFQHEKGYGDGLLRFGAAEKAFVEAKMLLLENKKHVNEDLSFTYTVKLDGANSPHIIDFDFKNNADLPYRINVLIGKNGTGKTQVLGGMVNSISGVKYQDGFSPFSPLFRKVIAISYSLFDDFPKPEATTVFSYKYIGLRTKDEEIVSDEILGEKLRKSLSIILREDRVEVWFHSVNQIIQLENLGIENTNDLTEVWIQTLSYKNAKRLSSGQSITLFILTDLIANIQEESLILFDEPETHLHPSAIAQLMNSFYGILEYYKSFAVLSTHSPIVIQDVPSKYITIFDRQGNSPIMRRLPLESFGENISVLTSKVFETIEVKELYKRYLDELSYRSVDAIDGLFENGLSINAQLYLTALKNIDRNEKP